MPQYRIHTSALDAEGCEAVHRATLELLEGTGVEVQHEAMLARLASAGAGVEGSRVRIPAGLVDDALAAAPRSITLTSRGAGPALDLSDRPRLLRHRLRLPRRPRSRREGPPHRCARRRRRDGGAPGEAREHRLRPLHGPSARTAGAGLAPVAQFAAMLRGTSKPLIMVPEDAAHLEVVQRDGRCVRRRGQLGDLRHAHAAAHSRQGIDGPPRRLRTPRHPHDLRQRLPAGRDGAGLGGRLCRARQRRDAERARHLRARRPRRSVRLRSGPGLDGAALGAHRVLRARRRWRRSRHRPTWRATTACRRSATAAAPTR